MVYLCHPEGGRNDDNLPVAQDIAAPAEVGDYLLAHIPHVTLVTLATTGHCPHLSAPLETLSAMEAFLAEVA